jgi:hypothetical protein
MHNDDGNSILKAWTATFVRRWHTQPLLSNTDDFISGHQQRSTLLLLLFWPQSTRRAIIDCITHDQGEDDSGDMAHPAKRAFPELRGMLETVEDASMKAQGLERPWIAPVELKRRKWVDLLDSYLWMMKHQPHMRHRPEWKAQLTSLIDGAAKLGAKKFPQFITAATKYLTGD